MVHEQRKQEEGDSAGDDANDPDNILDSLIPRNRLLLIKESGRRVHMKVWNIESIKELLNEPFIQKAIVTIMSSDNKERTLNNLKSNSEMSLLIDELLLCVGVAKRRDDGSIEFTGV